MLKHTSGAEWAEHSWTLQPRAKATAASTDLFAFHRPRGGGELAVQFFPYDVDLALATLGLANDGGLGQPRC